MDSPEGAIKFWLFFSGVAIHRKEAGAGASAENACFFFTRKKGNFEDGNVEVLRAPLIYMFSHIE